VNRIFVSYRTLDAKKDAHRLAVDLERIFGEDQVFFDKHDLQGGAAWRDAIGNALGQRPVVLLVMTPELFGAVHPEGGLRIDREDDPIRSELLSAKQHGALIVPLLTEGMTMPGRQALPAPLHFLLESHALKLRTDDWAHDLQRLVADLVAQGIQPRPGALPGGGDAPAPASLRAEWILFWGGVALALLVFAGVEHDADADTYVGAGVLLLVSAAMSGWAFVGLKRAGRSSRWAALGLCLLWAFFALGAFLRSSEMGEAAVGGYRPPVTSMTAPVV
jgi:hypothetical protein